MLKLILIGLLLATATLANIDDKCLKCICQIESNCRNEPCRMDGGSLSCGYYQIKEAYWIDCGRPGGSWQACAASLSCSEQCVRAYMNRYGTYCTGLYNS